MRGNRQTRDRSVWLGVTVALVLGILCGGSMDISRSYAAEGIGSRQEAVRKNAGAGASPEIHTRTLFPSAVRLPSTSASQTQYGK